MKIQQLAKKVHSLKDGVSLDERVELHEVLLVLSDEVQDVFDALAEIPDKLEESEGIENPTVPSNFDKIKKQ